MGSFYVDFSLLLREGFFIGEIMEKKIAVVSAILEAPQEVQNRFNEIIAEFRGIVKGRTGIPFDQYGISVITIIILGTVDEINHFTGKLGNLKHVSVKTSISKKTIVDDAVI